MIKDHKSMPDGILGLFLNRHIIEILDITEIRTFIDLSDKKIATQIDELFRSDIIWVI